MLIFFASIVGNGALLMLLPKLLVVLGLTMVVIRALLLINLVMIRLVVLS